jgi:hypothetical protein
MKVPNKKDYPSFFIFSIRKKKFYKFMKSVYTIFIVSFLILFLLFDISLFFFSKSLPQEEEVSEVNYSIGPDCENLSFENTSICLNNYVRKVFVYNQTDDSINLSLEEITSRGGDCKDWTSFYERYMNFYGFNQTQIVNMFVRGEKIEGREIDYYHVFLTVSDPSGYCNFDMQDLECYRFVSSINSTKEDFNGM